MAIFAGPEIVNSGLVLHLDAANSRSYPGSGTAWYDLSGLGGYAQAYNSPTYIPNESFNFDGAADYFRLVRTDLNGGTFAYPVLTIEMWIKPGTLGNTGAQSNNIITVENSVEISIGNRNNGYSGVNYASTPWAWAGSDTDLLVNSSWSQLVYTHSLIDRKLYVNGRSVFTSTATGGISVGNASWPYLTLMGRSDGTGAQAEGNVSMVKIYNRPLSEAEIRQNFEASRDRYGI